MNLSIIKGDKTMKYGAMNFPIRPTLNELERIAALGFDYLELTLDPPEAHYSIINRLRHKLLDALDRHGMGIVCHLPTFVYTADLSPGIRQASLEEVLASLEMAAQLKAMKVVLHPSIISGMGAFVMESALTYSTESLAILTKRADDLGVTLCFENMFPRYNSFWKPDEFEQVLDTYPELKMTLDTGHANINDPDGTRLYEFIRRFGDRIGHVHASNNSGKRDDHFPTDKGTIKFPKVVAALKGINYNDTITLEIFSEDPQDLTRSREHLAALFEGSS